MGKFSGYLICTDCDGTLTYEEGKISDKNARAIKYFQENGGLFTLATGRFPDYVNIFSDKIKINAPIVSLNGTLLYDTATDHIIEKWYMNTEECTKLLEYMVEHFNGIEDIWVNGINEDGVFASTGYKPSIHNPGDGSIQETLNIFPNQMLKMVTVQSEEDTKMIQKDLKEKFGELFRFDTSWKNGLEIQSINSGKGIAVKYMKEHLNTHIHTTIGVGDYENDFSLLESSDIGYAVANALDSVKEEADRITVSNRQDALYEIIKDIEKETK